MRVADVALRVEADGDRLRVRIEAPEGRDSAPFELAAEQWRDLLGQEVGHDPDARGIQRSSRLVKGYRGVVAPAETLGETLHRALFPPEIRNIFERSRGASDRLRLRLEWDLSEPRVAPLQRLPWELLEDPATESPLALDRRVTLVRHVDVAETRRSPPTPRILRVLPVAASPREMDALDLDAELDGLLAMGHSAAGLDILPGDGEPIDLLALRRHLLERGGHVLHFMGHGEMRDDGTGLLYFEAASGRALAVSGDALALKLRDLHELRLVVLNACRTAEIRSRPFAGVATALVRGGVPAVLAMQAPISDRAAIAFSRELYRRLADGEPLDLATCEARHAVHALAPDAFEWAIPVLFLRPGAELAFSADRPDDPTPPSTVDEDEVLDRYLAWILETSRELDLPWLSSSEPRSRWPLERIYASFRLGDSPPTERPKRLEALARDALRLADLRRAGPSGEGHPGRLWDTIRQLASGGAIDASSDAADEPARSEPMTADELVRAHRRLVVLGPIGVGKSCLLRFVARSFGEARRAGAMRVEVAADRVDPLRSGEETVDLGPTRLPILLDVSRYAQWRRERPGLRLADYLGRHLGDTPESVVSDARGRSIDPEALHGSLCRALANGEALLLVDGLDRIEDPGERRATVREIEQCLDAFLPPDRPTPAEVGGAQCVVVARPTAYRQAPFARARHVELDALEPAMAEHFCFELARRLGFREPTRLVDVASRLRQQTASDTIATPLMLTLLAAILTRGGGRVPRSRLDLYEPAIMLLLERRELARLNDAALGESDLRAQLAELAANLHDRSASLGLVDRRFIERFFSERQGAVVSHLMEYLAAGGLGPLVPYGSGFFGFLHFAFQEVMAALWLVADLDRVAARLRSRLAEPQWRSPIAIALGILADRLDPERFDALLDDLLAASLTGRGASLPTAELAILDAINEMPTTSASSRPVIRALRRLWRVAAIEDGGPAGRAIEEAFARWLESDNAAPVVCAASDLLEEDDALGRPERLAAVARSAATARRIPTELAESLFRLRDLDRPPWPVDQALRRVVARRPTLLPPPRDAFHRAIRRAPDLATAIRRDPRWRRLVLALRGERPGSTDPLRHVSSLDARILGSVERGRDPRSMLDPLEHLAAAGGDEARDSRRALVALGEARRLAVPCLDEDLPRIRSASVDREIDAVLTLAEALPATERAPLVAWLWRRWLGRSGEPDDHRYRLAVVLDTVGGWLTDSLDVFVESWVLAGSRPVSGGRIPIAPDRRTMLALDTLAAIPDAYDFVRGWALVVLRPLIEAYDLTTEARVLVELTLTDRLDARATTRSRFGVDESPSIDELLAEASTLPDPLRRFRVLRHLAHGVGDRRRDLVLDRLARRRILRSPLSAAAHAIGDPAEREHALGLLAADSARCLGQPYSRAAADDRHVMASDGPIACAVRRPGAYDPGESIDSAVLALLAREATGRPYPRAIESRDEGWLTVRELDRRVVALDGDDDLERWRAVRHLVGDRTPTSRRWSARRAGLDLVLRAARHWLSRRLDDPRGALVLRWSFAAIEHDSPELLLALAATVETPGPRADEAEVALRFVETVQPRAVDALPEILRRASARARRALIEGLPNVLSRRDRRTEAVWAAVADHLPNNAAVLGAERVDLVGPSAVVEAAERAWAETGRSDDATAERASELHEATRVAWADLLARPPAARRAALEALGRRRRVGRQTAVELAAAVERLVAQPSLLPLLVAWTEVRLWPDVMRSRLDDHALADLLGLIAGAGRRLPQTYDRATRSRPAWRRRLGEAVRFSDLLDARRAAVEILGLEPVLGGRDLAALVTALGDVPEVQRAVLEAAGRFRQIEDLPDVLPALGDELRATSAARAVAAGRLIATMARPVACDDATRRQLERLLVEAAADPTARREVYVATYDDDPTSRRLGVEHLGRLGRLLRGLLLDLHGVPRPFLHALEES